MDKIEYIYYAYLTVCSFAGSPYADCNPPVKPGVEQRIEIPLGPHGPSKELCEKQYADVVRKTYTAQQKSVAKTPAEKMLVDYRQFKYECILQPVAK